MARWQPGYVIRPWNTTLFENWRSLESRPMNGYGCDYCNADATGGCFGFHACPEHLHLAARDGQDAATTREP